MSSTTTTILPTISLVNPKKEYHIFITGNDKDGYKVEYSYGDLGGKLTTKVKNRVPINLETAGKFFNEMLQKRLKEGYQISR